MLSLDAHSSAILCRGGGAATGGIVVFADSKACLAPAGPDAWPITSLQWRLTCLAGARAEHALSWRHELH
jgi:hypothetical protein